MQAMRVVGKNYRVLKVAERLILGAGRNDWRGGYENKLVVMGNQREGVRLCVAHSMLRSVSAGKERDSSAGSNLF
jgi:hypothetical protein